jgi:hypothetical protein
MPEGCVSAGAPSIDTHPRESSDLVTTLWLAGRGVYRSVDARRFEARVSDVRYSFHKPTFVAFGLSRGPTPKATPLTLLTRRPAQHDYSGLPTLQSDIPRNRRRCEAVMRAQSPIATATSATTDRRITELHLWAVRLGGT